MTETETYNLIWPDLPAYSALAPGARFWRRPKHWGSQTLHHWRGGCVELWLTQRQHLGLRAALEECASVAENILALCLERWPDGYLTSDGKLRWDPTWTRTLMNAMTRSNREVLGLEKDSDRWLRRDRATAHTVAALRQKVLSGSVPRLTHEGRLPCGVSVRLRAGPQYGVPFGFLSSGNGGYVPLGEFGVGWVRPEDLAALWASGCLEHALFAEVAHFEQRWWIRWVCGAERKRGEPLISKLWKDSGRPWSLAASMEGTS